MIRSLLRSVIQNATVTHAESSWPVALQVDAYLMHAAELLPFEEVEVVSSATGESWRTWIEPAAEGSGIVRVHAGTRAPARKGDTLSILAFAQLHDGQTLAHRPKVVTVDTANRVVAVEEGAVVREPGV